MPAPPGSRTAPPPSSVNACVAGASGFLELFADGPVRAVHGESGHGAGRHPLGAFHREEVAVVGHDVAQQPLEPAALLDGRGLVRAGRLRA